MASPSEKAYATINDSPEAITFSYDLKTTPVNVGGNFKPTACLTIDSKKVPENKLAELEKILYGSAGSDSSAVEARLPLPTEIITLVGSAVA